MALLRQVRESHRLLTCGKLCIYSIVILSHGKIHLLKQKEPILTQARHAFLHCIIQFFMITCFSLPLSLFLSLSLSLSHFLFFSFAFSLSRFLVDLLVVILASFDFVFLDALLLVFHLSLHSGCRSCKLKCL